jgi:hypothetical protein
MLEIALELAAQKPAYAEMGDKFLSHYLWIARAIAHAGEGTGMWDEELSHRLSSIFLRNEQGRRPVNGGSEKFQHDPHWRDLIQFYEYFHSR